MGHYGKGNSEIMGVEGERSSKVLDIFNTIMAGISPKLKKRHTHPGTGSIQSIKETKIGQ